MLYSHHCKVSNLAQGALKGPLLAEGRGTSRHRDQECVLELMLELDELDEDEE